MPSASGPRTDKADARLSAEYAQRERPPAWRPAPAETLELLALVRRRDDLRALAAREKGRLAGPGLTAAARESITRTVAFLEGEANCLQGQADDLIAASAKLREDRALLESIPGAGHPRRVASGGATPVGRAGGGLRGAGA